MCSALLGLGGGGGGFFSCIPLEKNVLGNNTCKFTFQLNICLVIHYDGLFSVHLLQTNFPSTTCDLLLIKSCTDFAMVAVELEV